MVVDVILYGIIGVFLGKLFMKIKSSKFAIKTALSTFISYIILFAITLIFIIISTIPGQPISIPILPIALFLLPSIAYGLVITFLLGKKGKKIGPNDPRFGLMRIRRRR